MKKFTKILSMVLLVAMCVSMFAVSASAAAVHVKQTSDTPAADGSVTYTVSNPSGAAITDVSWNTADRAVSALGQGQTVVRRQGKPCRLPGCFCRHVQCSPPAPGRIFCPAARTGWTVGLLALRSGVRTFWVDTLSPEKL